MNLRPPTAALGHRSGFTLVELLTVIAIIGILSSLLFVTFGGVTAGAKRAKTRVQFAQWATAMEAFRQEYGFYPDFRTVSTDTLFFGNGVVDSTTESQKFVETLSGREVDGDPLPPGSPGVLAGNAKSIRFCSFGQDDLDATNRLVDAFENAEIAVLVDYNFDGVITIGPGKEYEDFPEVIGLKPDIPANGVVRAGVIFYSPGAGKSTEDIVKSW